MIHVKLSSVPIEATLACGTITTLAIRLEKRHEGKKHGDGQASAAVLLVEDWTRAASDALQPAPPRRGVPLDAAARRSAVDTPPMEEAEDSTDFMKTLVQKFMTVASFGSPKNGNDIKIVDGKIQEATNTR